MLYQLRYRTCSGMTGKQFMRNLKKKTPKNMMTWVLMTKQQITPLGNNLKTLLLVQSEVPANIFPLRGEAASLAFTTPFQLDIYRKCQGLPSELSTFLLIILSMQKSVQLSVSTLSYGRRGLLYTSLVPMLTKVLPQLPACLPPGHREMRRPRI